MNTINPLSMYPHSWYAKNSNKLNGGSDKVFTGGIDIEEEDAAIYLSAVENSEQAGFDFTNMTRDEFAQAVHQLYEEGKINNDERRALQGAECGGSAPVDEYVSGDDPCFYSVKHNWIEEMEGMAESARYYEAQGYKTNPEHYESALRKITELTSSQDSSNTNNVPNLDFRNMTYEERIAAAKYLASKGIISQHQANSLILSGCLNITTGTVPFVYGLFSPLKFDFITMITQKIQFQQELGYGAGQGEYLLEKTFGNAG